MPILSNFFDILATNNDRGGKEFISQIEVTHRQLLEAEQLNLLHLFSHIFFQ